MLDRIIQYSVKNKLIVLLFSLGIIAFGLYSLSEIPIGAVPDITSNQVQIITTSRNLATEDVEKFLTYPVELEMANLPDVKEIRSVSKFGLSVVTVVFTDDIGTYLPRQLIAEKIKTAEEKIPAGFGKPFMGPITTGLGEIYQYVIEIDSAYRSDYNLSDIRTIQDWIVKRQLSGIKGVVEVNTWGGFLKQYEVAVDPEKLRSLNVPISKVYSALERNNSVAGGGYIEKVNQSYFIRGEGMIGSLHDIETIVVDTREGTPIFVRDIATVGFGHATRFGAVTGNGEGEKVLGQVMMLKDANSNAVIDAVKERVEEISATLPPGISINPFLERSELIEKTTFTIAENLILGCLIVIFVVVLLLGNIRSGLVVASVIPMCLLFALSLMYIFGVDANLMSLGAIDFGIIIDGAVIIVEYIAFRITAEKAHLLKLPRKERQSLVDKITLSGASKMMHSAVFGQLIIIIVFIPILSLVGVEGKMFRPMALVFCFALIGAMLLCFTYVPVMASLFIRPNISEKKSISQKLIAYIERIYRPTIIWALRSKKAVLAMASSLLIVIVILFTQMGGEFIPTLDEGDFVIQPILKTGTSLSKTVEATTRMEKILLQFPEVKQVVSRIGAAEVPTDPMSMEESDVIIKLTPKDEWVSAESKDELADKFKEALSEIPGLDFEFTQPIEMRFNELITGVRADLAIKVFGEDLDLLYNKALEIENAIRNIEGAADITVEKVAGLPQMSVKYDRGKIAKYGLNINELNDLISMGFAGLPAGTVFEGEKQFDLVLRYDKTHHGDIEDLREASIQLPSGRQLPLSEFAEISYTKGPAKISRDNTKRRIVIGVNVRGRDLESVVQDVKQSIDKNISLPVGYTIDYGGQFENLRTAKDRLLIAVPIALALIFILLYFAFGSAKEALLIYSAIPMSAVGGVVLLYLRDLPFSISAGVGFIALFGIAVLNGIVLIEEFKELKAHGIQKINKRILIGTRNRLRPVLLTASAAALGFLPMAISTSAGAEVQRPLATVVVGGLISATLLTLIVLPVLYSIFENKRQFKVKTANPLVTLIFALLSLPAISFGQEEITLEMAIELAIKKNAGLKASSLRIEENRYLEGSAYDIEKTEFYYNKDQNNIAPNNLPLNVWGVSQSLDFPTVYGAKSDVRESITRMASDEYQIDKRIIEKKVYKSYYSVIYWQMMLRKQLSLDSLYKAFEVAATKRYQEGATNRLELITAQSKSREISIALLQIQDKIEKAYIDLNKWLRSDKDFRVKDSTMVKLVPTGLDSSFHPLLAYYSDALQLYEEKISLEQQKMLPGLNASYFHGVNNGEGQQDFAGFQIGITVPLWFGSYRSNINAAETAKEMIKYEREDIRTQLISDHRALMTDINSHTHALEYYEKQGLTLATETTLHATNAYKEGEIDFLQYVLLLESSNEIESEYITTLYNYNLSVIEANFLID